VFDGSMGREMNPLQILMCEWPNGNFHGDQLIWLVVEPYPSEKYEFVSWDDDILNIWKNNPNVPNHQPDVLVHYPFLKFYLFIRFEPAHCFTK